jgi:hypothetical protein
MLCTKPIEAIHVEEASVDLSRSLSLFDIICTRSEIPWAAAPSWLSAGQSVDSSSESTCSPRQELHPRCIASIFLAHGLDDVFCLAMEAQSPKRTMPLAVVGVVTITTFLRVFASLDQFLQGPDQ